MPTLPFIAIYYSANFETRNDRSRSGTMFWWPFSVCDLWAGSIYCRLPWTGSSHLHHAGVVPKVHICSIYCPCVSQLLLSRCTANQTDLDGKGGRRSCDHTELLVNTFELGTLWDEYGLVSDIIVCIPFFILFLITKSPFSNSHLPMISLALTSMSS